MKVQSLAVDKIIQCLSKYNITKNDITKLISISIKAHDSNFDTTLNIKKKKKMFSYINYNF